MYCSPSRVARTIELLHHVVDRRMRLSYWSANALSYLSVCHNGRAMRGAVRHRLHVILLENP